MGMCRLRRAPYKSTPAATQLPPDHRRAGLRSSRTTRLLFGARWWLSFCSCYAASEAGFTTTICRRRTWVRTTMEASCPCLRTVGTVNVPAASAASAAHPCSNAARRLSRRSFVAPEASNTRRLILALDAPITAAQQGSVWRPPKRMRGSRTTLTRTSLRCQLSRTSSQDTPISSCETTLWQTTTAWILVQEMVSKTRRLPLWL
mmetsp:Transcript_29431/g.56520  ORF Transcript_29431/g.56520 Transcript_29431/m.56520 type:complete len:204 (+) Transcript_29431:1394-2005(+)